MGFTNEWNAVNRRTSEERLHFGTTGQHPKDVYTFDSLNRMTEFRRDTQVAAHPQGYLASMALDGADKLESYTTEDPETEGPTPPDLSPVVDTPHAFFGTGDIGLNQYSEWDGNVRNYNANGDLEYAVGPNIRSHYDADGRLIGITLGGDFLVNQIAQYVYDAFGRRVCHWVPNPAPNQDSFVQYTYGGNWSVIQESSYEGNVRRQFVDGQVIDEHLVMVNYPNSDDPALLISDPVQFFEKERLYYHSSSQGNVAALTDDSVDSQQAYVAAVRERYDYSVFGQPRFYQGDSATPGAASTQNKYLFQGRRYDPESQLYQYRYRYYSPQWGEFVTVDPSGLWTHGQGNGYSAFGTDCWNTFDPMGLQQAMLADGPGFSGDGADMPDVSLYGVVNESDFNPSQPGSHEELSLGFGSSFAVPVLGGASGYAGLSGGIDDQGRGFQAITISLSYIMGAKWRKGFRPAFGPELHWCRVPLDLVSGSGGVDFGVFGFGQHFIDNLDAEGLSNMVGWYLSCFGRGAGIDAGPSWTWRFQWGIWRATADPSQLPLTDSQIWEMESGAGPF